MNVGRIRSHVRRILQKLEITEPPVRVEDIAARERIEIRKRPFGDELCGMLVWSSDLIVIGVNEDHPPVRQRFTIAHELGHFVLHPNEGVHIDRTFQVQFRGPRSNTGLEEKEIEANRFAAELLMPLDFLHADLRDRSLIPDLGGTEEEPDQIKALAIRYEVSVQAMTIRLTNLGLGDILGGA